MASQNQEKSLNHILPELADPRAGHVAVKGVCLDSRDIQAGDVFFALKGNTLDATHFIKQAINFGASVVIIAADDGVETHTVDWRGQTPIIAVSDLKTKLGEIVARFYDFPSEKLHVIGVTGTNGKTSVTHFIVQMLGFLGEKAGLIGTLGQGRLEHLARTENTTPNAVEIQKIFNSIKSEGVNYMACECSSHGIAQHRLNGTLIEVAVFTNLSHDHLDYHGSLAKYGLVKMSLFTRPHLKCAVINLDDEFAQDILDAIDETVEVITYSAEGDHRADLYLEQLSYTHSGMELSVVLSGVKFTLNTFLLGEFNVSNLLATIAVLKFYKFDVNAIIKSAALLSTVPGRMEAFGHADDVKVIVDYAHTPDALEKVLKTLRKHLDGNICCVFGCGGNRDQYKREIMGEVAFKYADEIVITDDNPRGESSELIRQQILSGIDDTSHVYIESDRAKAIQFAIMRAKRGDCVLVAGKGHEVYQEINGIKMPFSDQLVVADAIHQRRIV